MKLKQMSDSLFTTVLLKTKDNINQIADSILLDDLIFHLVKT